MTTNDILENIRQRALTDAAFRKRLLETRSAKEPVSDFCRICRENGYELYEMDIISLGEEEYAAMKRSRKPLLLVFGGVVWLGGSTKKPLFWIVGGVFWQGGSTKKPLFWIVGGVFRLGGSTKNLIQWIVGGACLHVCSTKKLIK